MLRRYPAIRGETMFQIPNVKELLETASNVDTPASERMLACDALMAAVRIIRSTVRETKQNIDRQRGELIFK